MTSYPWLFNWLFPALFGACIGSFLNVCIYRMPLGKSVVSPGSRCAACGKPIRWFHNLPVFSWLFLRGTSACCGTKISGRYPVVEALTAAAAVAIWINHTPALALVYFIFTASLIVATFIDLDHFIIPDEITLGGCVAGLVLSTIVPEMQGTDSHWFALLMSLVGLLVGGGSLFIIAIAGSALLKKEAMGMGDVKFLAAMGAFLGWQAPLFIIAAASVLGSFIGIGLMISTGKRWGLKIPFGPFLALAAVIWIFGGKGWMDAYLAMFE